MTRQGTHNRSGPAGRRGFTLIEALLASVTLSVIVLAVGSAISSAQQNALEGQKAVMASMACDDLMAELLTLEYLDLSSRDGMSQPVGEMASLDGASYPQPYWDVGREVFVTEEIVDVESLGVRVRGLRVVVRAFDEHRTIASVETFVPEPVE